MYFTKRKDINSKSLLASLIHSGLGASLASRAPEVSPAEHAISRRFVKIIMLTEFLLRHLLIHNKRSSICAIDSDIGGSNRAW